MRNQSIGRATRAWVWGLLIGGAAGFGLGLLTAPEEGRRIRRRLAYQLDALGARVGAYIDNVLEDGAAGAARLDGDALVADAHEKAQQIREDIDALLGEIRHRKAG
jgi:gas vesicle protein